MIRILSILLLCCLPLHAASPFFYCPTTNDLVAIEITAKNSRMVALLSGNATTNSYTRFFIYNTNSTATLDGKTVFKPTNQAGRWEELNVLDVASGFRVAGAAASGNYLRGNATSFVPSAIVAADLNVLATAGGSAVLNSDSSGNIQGLANVRGSLMQGGITNWTTTAIGASGRVWTSDGTDGSWQPASAGTAGNPSASVGLSAVNGAAETFMRSDGAPALDMSITPTWTGLHTFGLGATIRQTSAYNDSPITQLKGDLIYTSGGSYRTLAYLSFGKENANDADDAGYVALHTRPNGGSTTDRFHIDSAGLTGFGTTTPVAGIDLVTFPASSKTFAKVGDNWPIYVVGSASGSGYPAIGYNLYYSTAWKFGKGSAENYGMALGYNPSSGAFDFYSSDAAGDADATATPVSRLSLSAAGVMNLSQMTASRYMKSSSGKNVSTTETETANYVFAGATSGGAAVPAFRALVAADVPSLDASKITTGVITAATAGIHNIVRKSANYSASASDNVIVCNGETDFTITLPTSSVPDGHEFIIIRSGGAGSVTINPGPLDTLTTAWPIRSYIWLNTEGVYKLLYSQPGS